jgi:hypothetical protein
MEGKLDRIEGKDVWLKGAEDGRSDTYQMKYLCGSYAYRWKVLNGVAFPRSVLQKN